MCKTLNWLEKINWFELLKQPSNLLFRLLFMAIVFMALPQPVIEFLRLAEIYRVGFPFAGLCVVYASAGLFLNAMDWISGRIARKAAEEREEKERIAAEERKEKERTAKAKRKEKERTAKAKRREEERAAEAKRKEEARQAAEQRLISSIAPSERELLAEFAENNFEPMWVPEDNTALYGLLSKGALKTAASPQFRRDVMEYCHLCVPTGKGRRIAECINASLRAPYPTTPSDGVRGSGRDCTPCSF